MDRRERIYDPEEMLRMALDAKQTQIWTAMPAIVQSFNPAAMTCEVKPTITGLLRTPEGNYSQVEMPLLLDCPVFFPGGGGVTLTFPIKPGDECLVIFASRCIDSWWQLGGIRGQAEYRMHDISDGFVFAGVRSQPRAFDVDTTSAQLRSDDGLAFIEINPETHNIKAQTSANIDAESGGNISATAAAEIVATAPLIKLIGNVEVTGTITATGGITGGGIALTTHVHDGVMAGGANTGAPVA